MAQSVTNEALWVKLLEIDKKLDKHSVEQETPVSTQEPAENKPDFTAVKEEIITEIKVQSGSLYRHYDDIFKAANQDIKTVNGNILKVFDVVSRIRKQQREAVESQGKQKESYFNFWLFKVRKTSFIIAMLALLVLILTLFCMKQQNDYSLLMDEYYRQGIIIKEVKLEEESLKRK
jgi:hypothetical protein